MPIHTLFPAFVLLIPVWTTMVPVSSHPQHSQCQLMLKTVICNNVKLSSVPVGLPSNIEDLQLNHNHIQTLLDNSLTQYPSVSSLGLAGNHMERLEQNTFQYSQLIDSLNLAENCLHIGYHETSKALSKLPVLRALDLSENQLEDDMASVLLQNLTSLEYLNLSRNLLLRLDESSFSNLPQLRELDLQRNRLFELDHAFEGTPRLERLNLAFNYLPCLIDFHITQLVVLNASHNSIEWFIARQDLPDTFCLETLDLTDNNLLFFPFLPSKSRLQNLYLSHNSIRFYEHLAEDPALKNWTTSVEFFNLNNNGTNVTVSLWDEGLHGDISSLEILDLRGNQVGYFPKGFIRKMPSLSRLRLCTNCLEALNLNSEQFSSSLLELDISNNRLGKIVANQSALAALGNLSYFNLSLNHLKRLPCRLFSSLPSLRSVDLSYNSISICPSEAAEECADTVSDCLVWRHVDSLRKLYLKGCELRRVPPSTFMGMLLTHLDLSDNPGLLVEPGSIQELSRTLQHLGLGNTGIQAFDFSSLTRLRSLNISRNLLTHIPSSLPDLQLQTLDLRDNKLSTIPSGQASALAQTLQTVFLSGNQFNCCQTDWYRTFETTQTVSMVDQPDISCEDGSRRMHKVHFFKATLCGDVQEESVFWYLLLVTSVCLCFCCIMVIVHQTKRPNLLQKAIEKKCLKPTCY